ncbi:hypothetical protein BDQ94DRAFT_177502 [Aspergillus welwitschiae]|uniref:Uncharacterized protein n=1 Tax=Aspergillus welwitschiae TaxID=1341132 RepID=A0A3F3PHX1_9EURO|nr:hypothetical protein BDQ94DRAFT_177502 [Aspergillus welwitschiae]RDH26498.1 hypothetical protein BDQ94DRAFT_177502 [Aspergillus welwitschiae]
MYCLTSIVPKGMRRWLVGSRFQSHTTIDFIGVERGPDDLVVTCLRGRFRDRLLWSNFKAIGQPAIVAVARAGWHIQSLDDIANSIREGRFDELELERARENAKKNLTWINRSSSGPPSQFD